MSDQKKNELKARKRIGCGVLIGLVLAWMVVSSLFSLLDRHLFGGTFQGNMGALIALILFSLFAAVALISFFSTWKQIRRLEDTPTSLIGSASQGYVELVGTLSDVDQGVVTAPLSGKACAYWWIEVFERGRRNRRSDDRRIARLASTDFAILLRDASGQCYVDSSDLRIGGVEERASWGVNSDNVGTLQRLDRNDVLKAFDGRARWVAVEHYIPPQTAVRATGFFKSLSSNEDPFQDHWAEKAQRAGWGSSGLLARQKGRLLAAMQDRLAVARQRWQERMARLEGREPGESPRGTQRVHTLLPRYAEGDMVTVAIGPADEKRLIRRHRLTMATTAGFFFLMLGLLGVLVVSLAR